MIRDLTGQRFGRLLVVSRAENSASGKPRWNCICDCGNAFIASGNALKSGYTKSCGCYNREVSTKNHYRHGGHNDRLYGVWNMMKQRCGNRNNRFYKNYGGRGITICDEWKDDYESFKLWSMENGYDPTATRGECTIDRIDNDKGYCPENCRWTNKRVQANNCRTNRWLTYKGRTKTVSQWAKETGICASTIIYRDNHGWPVEKTLSVSPLIGRNQEWRKTT